MDRCSDCVCECTKNFLIADRGGSQLLRMYINRIPVKLDRKAFRSTLLVGFRPLEKAEHQGCCGRILLDSGQNRNPVQGSGISTNRNKNRNVQPRAVVHTLPIAEEMEMDDEGKEGSV